MMRMHVRGTHIINRLLRLRKVAALLQTSRIQVRCIIQIGKHAALKVGREYRISLVTLENLYR